TALMQAQKDVALPHGIAQLLAAQCEQRCETVATEEVPARYLLHFLGGLASALCATGERFVPLGSASELGLCVAAWLEVHRPQVPAARHQSGGIGLSGEQIEALCAAGMDAGLVLVSPDGAALRFTHRLIAASCAALWLLDHDDPEAPLDPRFLGEQW